MTTNILINTIKYLDPHLALVILESYEDGKYVPVDVVLNKKIEVLTKTGLFSDIEENLKNLKEKSPSSDVDRLIESKNLF